jgi:broad specificity phosphatase PhoE
VLPALLFAMAHLCWGEDLNLQWVAPSAPKADAYTNFATPATSQSILCSAIFFLTLIYPHKHHAPIAQLVEQLPLKETVPGSSPGRRTIERMKILLIRHGETTGDVEDRYGGDYDDHLTEKGREQLGETAKSLVGVQVDKIYSSSLIRAQESAGIINATLNTEIEFLDGLRERNYGVLGGLTKAEALQKYPEAVELHKDSANTDPEGESQSDFTERVLKTFQSISYQSYDTIALVSHGGPIKVILRHLDMPIPEKIGDGEIIEIDQR